VGGRIDLILEQAAKLPAELRWQGFAVGKSAGDSILADATLRMFVPPKPDEKSLVLEQVSDHDALLFMLSIRPQATIALDRQKTQG